MIGRKRVESRIYYLVELKVLPRLYPIDSLSDRVLFVCTPLRIVFIILSVPHSLSDHRVCLSTPHSKEKICLFPLQNCNYFLVCIPFRIVFITLSVPFHSGRFIVFIIFKRKENKHCCAEKDSEQLKNRMEENSVFRSGESEFSPSRTSGSSSTKIEVVRRVFDSCKLCK